MSTCPLCQRVSAHNLTARARQPASSEAGRDCSMAPTQSRPRDAVKENELTQELLDRACAGALGAACEAKWILVDEAVRAGRLQAYQAPGAKFLIAKRAARRSGRGKYKEFRAKFSSSYTYYDPGFYAAAPLN